MKSFKVISLLAFSTLLVSTGAVFAQDPAVVNSTTVRVKLDNDGVRTLEAVLKPGDKESLHSHPVSVIYVISGGKVRNHTSDGKVTESELVSGSVAYREPVTHWAENIGTTTIHLILVELKPTAAPGS